MQLGLAPAPAPPVVTTQDLSDTAYGWCVASQSPKDKCRTIGQNFILAANGADSVTDIIQRVANANRTLNQAGVESVLAQIQQYLLTNLRGKDLESHRRAFDEIGTGLLRYAGFEGEASELKGQR